VNISQISGGTFTHLSFFLNKINILIEKLVSYFLHVLIVDIVSCFERGFRCQTSMALIFSTVCSAGCQMSIFTSICNHLYTHNYDFMSRKSKTQIARKKLELLETKS